MEGVCVNAEKARGAAELNDALVCLLYGHDATFLEYGNEVPQYIDSDIGAGREKALRDPRRDFGVLVGEGAQADGIQGRVKDNTVVLHVLRQRLQRAAGCVRGRWRDSQSPQCSI